MLCEIQIKYDIVTSPWYILENKPLLIISVAAAVEHSVNQFGLLTDVLVQISISKVSIPTDCTMFIYSGKIHII